MSTTHSTPALTCPHCSGAGIIADSLIPGRCHPCRGTGSALCDVCGERHAICASDGTSMCLACLGIAVGEAKRDFDVAHDAWSRALRGPSSARAFDARADMERCRAQRDALVALASHHLSANDGPEPPPRAPAPTKPNGRHERGAELAKDSRVRHDGGSRWLVPSQSGKGSYNVDVKAVTCTCVDFERHGQRCKHIVAAETVARRSPILDGAA